MRTLEDLRQRQALPLEAKIEMSMNRIRECYYHFGGAVYVSFSGGKDSTVLLDLVRSWFPNVEAVFVDTGLEYPGIREFVRSADNVTWLRPKMSFREIIEKYGYPLISKEVAKKIREARRNPNSRAADHFREEQKERWGRFSLAKWNYLKDSDILISDECCKIQKKDPAREYQKKSGKVPFFGIMADESLLRRQGWMRHGCNAFDLKKPFSSPLSFWTEQDVLRYILDHKLPYAKTYGDIKADEDGKLYTTGAQRTGCMFCAFGAHCEKNPNRFQRMKQTHPKIYDYCMRPWDQGGLGMAEVLAFIGVETDYDQIDIEEAIR